MVHKSNDLSLQFSKEPKDNKSITFARARARARPDSAALSPKQNTIMMRHARLEVERWNCSRRILSANLSRYCIGRRFFEF